MSSRYDTTEKKWEEREVRICHFFFKVGIEKEKRVVVVVVVVREENAKMQLKKSSEH